jgi:hypothetical protein
VQCYYFSARGFAFLEKPNLSVHVQVVPEYDLTQCFHQETMDFQSSRPQRLPLFHFGIEGETVCGISASTVVPPRRFHDRDFIEHHAGRSQISGNPLTHVLNPVSN